MTIVRALQRRQVDGDNASEALNRDVVPLLADVIDTLIERVGARSVVTSANVLQTGTISATTQHVFVSAEDGDVALRLSPRSRSMVTIVRTDDSTNSVTVQVQDGSLIDGSETFSLDAQRSVMIIADGEGAFWSIASTTSARYAVELSTLRGAFDGDVVTLRGYAEDGDGGEGAAYWDALDASTYADGGVVFGSGVGRWKRIKPDGVANVRWWGAKGDGDTDDSEAFRLAMGYCFRDPAPGTNDTLYIPSGNYVIEEDECWNRYDVTPYGHSQKDRENVAFRGDGRLLSIITQRPGGSGDVFLMDSANATETDGEVVWSRAAFQHMAFIQDDTGKTAGRINLFRQFTKSGFPSQMYRFFEVEFEGPGVGTNDQGVPRYELAGSLMTIEGDGNGAENSFVQCRASRGVRSIFRQDNNLSTNNHALSCHWENMSGSVYYAAAGSGILHYGGSIIYSSANPDVLENFILRLESPDTAEINGTAGDYTFINLKVEFRNAFCGIVKRTGSQDIARVAFRDCDFQVAEGGDRDAIQVGNGTISATVYFDNCVLRTQTGDLLRTTIGPGAPLSWTGSYGRGHTIRFIACRVPLQFHDTITWAPADAQGVVRISQCWFNDNLVSTEEPDVSFEADIRSPTYGPQRAKAQLAPQLKSYFATMRFWSTGARNRDGLDSRLWLPPDHWMKRIRVTKGAKGGTIATYQFAVINDDGSHVYGLSPVGGFNTVLTLDVEPWRYLTTGIERYLRVVCTRSLAYTLGGGTFQLGQVVTGGTSGATGVIVENTGTALTLVLGNFLAFTPGELITTGTGSGTAGATTSREATIAGTRLMDTGDHWHVEYV